MKASIYNGLYNPMIALSDVSASCNSGNCSWPQYNSLAICALTSDVTSSLRSSCSNSTPSVCNYSLPNGPSLASKNEHMSLLTTDDASPSVAFAQINSVTDFFTFLISNKTGQPILLESVLQLCVQTYNTTVINGRTETKELGSSSNLNSTLDYTLYAPDDDTTYVVSRYSFNTMNTYLKTIFQGRYAINDGLPTYGSDAIEVLVDSLLAEPYDLAAMIDFLNGMATSMTNT